MRSRPLFLFSIVISLLVSSQAMARPLVVVLAFRGAQGTEVRDTIVGALVSMKYDVASDQKLLKACDELGVTPTRGKNLALVATYLGAVAVVGGAIEGRRLSVAVFSGKTGLPLITGSLPFEDEITQPVLARALTLILKGLQKAPKSVVANPPAPPARSKEGGGEKSPLDLVREASGDEGGEGGSGGEGEDDTSDAAAADSGGGGTGSGQGNDSENPLRRARPAPAAPPPTVTAPAGPPPTRVQAQVSLGTWMRSFSLKDPWLEGPKPAPSYDATAFTLRFDARLYPLAFFSQSWPSGFMIQLHYQQALGLSTDSPQTANIGTIKSHDTSMRELLLGLGYDWKIFRDRASGPHLELTAGFGLMDFEIQWEDSVVRTLPAAAYRFFLASAAFRYDFVSWLGARLGFDYRALGNTGEIETEEWYGRSTTNGIGLSASTTGNWKGLTITAEYDLAYYFYDFSEPIPRQESGKNAAGGANDVMHSLVLGLGYSF